MTTTPDFETWWAEIQREPGVLRDSHDTARRLGRRLDSMGTRQQQDFLKQLVPVLLQRHRAYGIALFLLDSLSDRAVLDLIAANLSPFPALQTHDEEAHLADLVRILAAAREERLLPAVRSYLLDREIGAHWATVPWALWPHEHDLFVKAWLRFFGEKEPEDWTDPLVVRSFLGDADAIRAVKTGLESSGGDWPRLREALLRQAGRVSWISPDQLNALQQDLL